MSKIGGTQVNVGLGLEATAGTAVAATVFPKWAELSMQGVSEKTMLKSARGNRAASSDSRIRRQYSKGSLAVIPNNVNSVPLFYLALGSLSSSSVADSAYTHTVTVQDANASMKTATMIVEQGSEVTERFANVVCDSLNLEVSDDYAKLTAGLIGAYPDTSTLSESFAQQTEFAYSDYTAKFGTSFSAAGSASATPLKGFTLNINNNILVDEAFLSGAVTPVAGGFVGGRLQISGSYTLHFDGTTELDKYKANTKNALIVTFTGALIGASSTQNLQIKLGKLILTSPPKEYNLDGLVILKQEFSVEHDPTDGLITVIGVNTTATYA